MSAWYVVYTQPGAEMLAQGELENQGFEVYCPRYSRNVRHARSVKRSILALFPRYLFVRILHHSKVESPYYRNSKAHPVQARRIIGN